LPVLIEEIVDKDSYPPEGVSEPEQMTKLTFNDDIETATISLSPTSMAKTPNTLFEQQAQFHSVWQRPL
jgi:hypothetical protein